jgi:hypothetical protein
MTPSGWMSLVPGARVRRTAAAGRAGRPAAGRPGDSRRAAISRPAGAAPRRAYRRGRAGSADGRDPWSPGQPGSRPDRRRDPGKPAGAAGAGQRDERSRAGWRLRRPAQGEPAWPPSGGSRITTCAGFRCCPGPAQQLMLLGGGRPHRGRTLLWRAAQKLGLGPDAAAAAERSSC